MTRLELDPKDKVVITTDPQAPEIVSIVPTIDCQQAIDLASRFRQTAHLKVGELLILLQHLTDEEHQHESNCPFYQPDLAPLIRQSYENFIHPG